MYLKSLELHGFKSFPEKTVLSFDKPVTAIVGPNGSGKSNIADALQWVMGEQSTKALRGGKMEDVIFGGTERRSQVGFAEVTLTLDNTDRRLPEDSDSVRVSRRFYRSGDSEYRINTRQVRLRDINELFMDTGLGKEGYSIIGQGKIDSILSARSTDRREIFEEAAGISRYRHRKEEAENKLERAEEDLTRIGDKISELELQVVPLKKQAETAKKYLLLRDELRGLEISLWVLDLENIAERTSKLREDKLTADSDLSRAREELEELYNRVEENSTQMREKDIEIEKMRERMSAAERRVSENESEMAVLETTLKHDIENISRIESEIERQQTQNAGLQEQICEHKQRISEIEAEKRNVLSEYESMSREIDTLLKNEDGSDTELSNLSRQSMNLSDELSHKKAERSSINALLEEMSRRTAAAEDELEKQREEFAAALNNETNAMAELKETGENLIGLKNILRGYELRANGIRQESEDIAKERAAVESDHNGAVQRRGILREMEREYEGYSKAVKTVMRESVRGTLRGVRGPVGELVKTPDKYALAIETALGAAMQNIIVETEQTGRSAINLLKRQSAGRVTFMPMSVMRGGRLQESNLENEEGFEGIASDLIEYDKQYENIYTNLLGRTVITDDLDNAIRIAGHYRHRFKIVTLDGQVLNAGGSMTGGSASRNTGILSRANELKALDKTVEELAVKLRNAASRQTEVSRRLAEVEYNIKTASDEVRSISETEVRLKAESEHYRAVTESARLGIEKLANELKEAAKRKKESENRGLDVDAAIAVLEEKIISLRDEIDRKTGDREQLRRTREELNRKLSAFSERQTSLDMEKAAHEKSVSELNELRESLSGNRETQLATITALRDKCVETKNSITERKSLREKLEDEIASYKSEITALAENKLLIEGERTRNDRAAQEKNRSLLSLERESARIEQKQQTAAMEEKQIIEKLWDTYELSRSAAIAARKELESVPAAKKRTGELRKAMSALGTPNLGAIEEFERVNSRYMYLTDQRGDIAKSRTELLKIIDDITGSMTDIFVAEFQRIGDSFKEVFLELFGGGKASIELEDEQHPLESGIEIRVQPPGKALKTLTLLSGGEKAFVAIALYFAILKIRPTPFVVMDEIEAALDEANVIRVSEYMRKLSDKTQFIAITHRRGTMEEADVLYGVTMQERGVSRVLMIDLDEAEKTIGENV